MPALVATALVILRLAANPIGDSQAPAGPDWAAALERQRSLAAKAIQRAAEQGHAQAQVRGSWFTLGSHQNDVLRIQGSSTETRPSPSDSNIEEWYYGLSGVYISKSTRQVRGWDNSEGNLKVQLLPGNSGTDASSFTLGSHQDDVIRVQGTPIKIHFYYRSGAETWHYGGSEVTIDRDTRQVLGWDNSEGNLEVHLPPGNSGTDARSFSLGSHQDDVLRLHGTPIKIQFDRYGTETWHYGGSEVTIDGYTDGRKRPGRRDRPRPRAAAPGRRRGAFWRHSREGEPMTDQQHFPKRPPVAELAARSRRFERERRRAQGLLDSAEERLVGWAAIAPDEALIRRATVLLVEDPAAGDGADHDCSRAGQALVSRRVNYATAEAAVRIARHRLDHEETR